jgi:putative membrane protein
MAAGSGQFEIQSSQLAKEKAGDAKLKATADMIIADHTKASEKLKALLDARSQPLSPAPPAPKQQKMLEQLKAASGEDFEILYLDMQDQAHMEAIGLFRTYAGSGDDQSLVGFAKETLPRLETHLGHVKELIAAQQP